MDRQRGFTLIELMIVILVIGILAAIIVHNFTSVKTKSVDAAAKADIRNMITAQENHFAENQAYVDASVPAGARADLDGDGDEDFRASHRVTLGVTAYTDGFQITATHAISPNTWCVNSSSTNASLSPGAIVKATSC